MPYITTEERLLIDTGSAPKNSGQLNYCFTTLLIAWNKGELSDGELVSKMYEYCETYWYNSHQRYHVINDIIGALCCSEMEFYRRTCEYTGFRFMDVTIEKFYKEIAAPYEGKAIERNGDVY